MDATSYESSFEAELKDAVETTTYMYMMSLQEISLVEEFESLYEITRGDVEVEHRHFVALLPESKKSGEMDTSLSNSLTTLLVAEFIAEETKQSVNVIAEGDDNLANWSVFVPDATHFKRLGIIAKIETPADIASASFCGLVFSLEDSTILTNPFTQLAKFAWASGQYVNCSRVKKRILLRVKALSYLYQFPGCPVVQELAVMGLRLSSGVTVRDCWKEVLSKRNAGLGGMYWTEVVLKALSAFERGDLPVRAVTDASRFQMEKVFGFSVDQQLRTEDYLARHSSGPLILPELNFPSEWSENYERFVVDDDFYSPSFSPPVGPSCMAELIRVGVRASVVRKPRHRR
jgi:hypothetical protein